MTEWQPIETAPRDGTWVLVYRKEDGTRNPISIRHWRRWQRGSTAPTFEQRWVDEWSQSRSLWESTHWMPLPEVP